MEVGHTKLHWAFLSNKMASYYTDYQDAEYQQCYIMGQSRSGNNNKNLV